MYETNAARVARKMGELVSHLYLDLEQTGIQVARDLPHLTYNRLRLIFDVAEQEKEMITNTRVPWDEIQLW